jgi:hypothetical protein
MEMMMAVANGLAKLNFVKAPQRQAKDPVQSRRDKLVEGLEHQLKLIEDPNYVVMTRKKVKDDEGNVSFVEQPKPMRSWVKEDADGTVHFRPRYGNRALDFGDGKDAIAFKTMDELVKGVTLLIEVTKRGEMDSHLEAAMPKGFARKKK